MNRDDALAALAAFSHEKDNKYARFENTVILPPEVLEEITVADLRVDVPVEIRTWEETPFGHWNVPWNGRLILGANGSLWAVIVHDLFPGLWARARDKVVSAVQRGL